MIRDLAPHLRGKLLWVDREGLNMNKSCVRAYGKNRNNRSPNDLIEWILFLSSI